MKPRIAIFITWLDGGGAEKQVRLLLEALQHDFEIHLILTRSDSQNQAPQTVKVFYLNATETSGWQNFARIPSLSRSVKSYLESHDIRLVYAFLFRPNLIACYLRRLGWQGKIIISERSAPIAHYSLQGFKGRLVLRLLRWLYPNADLINPNSLGTQVELAEKLDIKTQYLTIYNPLDIENVQKRSTELVDDVVFDRFTFICVSNLLPHKNQKLLIEAFSRLNRPDCQLILVGGGKDEPFLKNLVVEKGLTHQVFVLGYQNNSFKYMAKSDCFVTATLVEGFPNAQLEALCLGLPVISSDCASGPRELLAPETDYRQQLKKGYEIGEFGILVAPNDTEAMTTSLHKILTDNELRQNYSKVARERAAEFHTPRIVEQFKKMLGELS